MPTPVFTWTPSYTSSITWKPRVLKMQFGDGYEQVVPDGINNKPMMFNIVFRKISDVEAEAIIDFLEARGEAEAFLWTAPAPHDDTQRIWKTEGGYQYVWDESNGNTITTIFKQVFAVT